MDVIRAKCSQMPVNCWLHTQGAAEAPPPLHKDSPRDTHSIMGGYGQLQFLSHSSKSSGMSAQSKCLQSTVLVTSASFGESLRLIASMWEEA